MSRKTKLDLVDINIRREILNLYSQGKTYREIRDIVKKKFNLDISLPLISYYIKRTTNIGRELIYRNPVYIRKLATEFSEILLRLKTASDSAVNLLHKLESKPDPDAHEIVPVLQEIRNQCECALKVLGIELRDTTTSKDTIMRIIERINSNTVKDTVIAKREI